MNINFKIVRYHGELENERLVLHVAGETDIGDYIVFAAEAVDNGISNKLRQTFWFPDKIVKAGDLVVLYTKIGRTKERLNSDKTTTHFFYWQLKTSLWGGNLNTPAIMHINEWKVFPSKNADYEDE